VDRFTNHVVKKTPVADSGGYSGIAADKVSSKTRCQLSQMEMVLTC